ncbi:MAG: CDF family Co(II)/Ni(II) efflux transporter DmeF [Neisseriaceae bacterium]|nr:CDF family Co(II)/Ni(II) efflux transporter DmeF [Neisseriaceae bacterium]
MTSKQDSKQIVQHDFGNHSIYQEEKKTKLVTIITLVTMVAEISVGIWSGSMALLADGVHMGGHALALGLATLAYYLTRKYADDRSFTWGSGKINDLVAYTSSIFLMGTIVFNMWESVNRLFNPVQMLYKEAAIVAFIGLLVNLFSIFILVRNPENEHHHHSHGNHNHHSHSVNEKNIDLNSYDNNFKAAVIHVAADSATSVAALLGIFAAWAWGWNWLDPMIGLIASVVILKWSVGLLKSSGSVLLDKESDADIKSQVIDSIKVVNPQADIMDLHIWSVGPRSFVVVAIIGSSIEEDSSNRYRTALERIEGVYHPVIEIQPLSPSI